MWIEHYKNLLGNSPKVTDKTFTKIINNQVDIKRRQFILEELYVVLITIKNKKVAGSEVWKTRKFDDLLLRYCNAVYNQYVIERWTKGRILPFPKKGESSRTTGV